MHARALHLCTLTLAHVHTSTTHVSAHASTTIHAYTCKSVHMTATTDTLCTCIGSDHHMTGTATLNNIGTSNRYWFYY